MSFLWKKKALLSSCSFLWAVDSDTTCRKILEIFKFRTSKRLKISEREREKKKWVITQQCGMIKQLLRLPKTGMALTKSFSVTHTELQQRFQLFPSSTSSSVSLSLKVEIFKINVLWVWFCRLAYMEDKWYRGGMTKAKSSFSLATRYVIVDQTHQRKKHKDLIF